MFEPIVRNDVVFSSLNGPAAAGSQGVMSAKESTPHLPHYLQFKAIWRLLRLAGYLLLVE